MTPHHFMCKKRPKLELSPFLLPEILPCLFYLNRSFSVFF